MPKAPSVKASRASRASTTKTASRRSAAEAKVEPTEEKSSTKAKGKRKATKTQQFNYSLPYEELDLRQNPELYAIGVGEQGVFAVQPYKGELLPLWRFATPSIARTSSKSLWDKFIEYRSASDFVGCDMARKFIQMGFTRSRRYANHSGGRKYETEKDEHGKKVEKERGPQDEEKAECADIFKEVLERVKSDETYLRLKEEHLQRGQEKDR